MIHQHFKRFERFRSQKNPQKKRKKSTKKQHQNQRKNTPKKAIFCELASDPKQSKSQQAQNRVNNPSPWDYIALKNAYL